MFIKPEIVVTVLPEPAGTITHLTPKNFMPEKLLHLSTLILALYLAEKKCAHVNKEFPTTVFRDKSKGAKSRLKTFHC